MSKRAATDSHVDKRGFQLNQSTLKKFFKSDSQCETTTPTTLSITPQYMGIHIFSLEEITESIGLNREYRKFWNEKAYELCSDKEIRHKLNDKVAIQGAINTSWTLYKSGLLDILSWCMSWKY